MTVDQLIESKAAQAKKELRDLAIGKKRSIAILARKYLNEIGHHTGERHEHR